MNDPISTLPTADPLPSFPSSGGWSYGWPDQPAVPPKFALARWLVVLAVAGIVGRVLIMAACAHRISFADNLLNGGTGTFEDADRADHYVTVAIFISVALFLAFLGVFIAVSRRAKRGDALCAAVSSNKAVRLTSRCYLISVGIGMFLRSAFKSDDTASAVDAMRSVVHGDWATIVLNAVVVVFLGAIIVVTRREIAKARAAAAVG